MLLRVVVVMAGRGLFVAFVPAHARTLVSLPPAYTQVHGVAFNRYGDVVQNTRLANRIDVCDYYSTLFSGPHLSLARACCALDQVRNVFLQRGHSLTCRACPHRLSHS